MHVGLDTEEYALLQQIITHYAIQLSEARDKNADLTRQIECMRERMALLECSIYGSSFL
jgi:demethoxyubiquinone hydroxylase (CLK1/Coq7/Cat5 family)